MTRYRLVLLATFALVWIWAAINPHFRHDWLLENYLVLLFVPLIVVSGRYFRLSDLSYTLITIFMVLHVVGSHYTYSNVPFGFTLQEWCGADRNMYDRLVHFSFGLLLAYPMREVFVRITRARGFWGYYLPLDVVLSFSAVYEVIEWLTAANVDPQAGLAFLGTQGDVWDAQKDMLAAGVGALVAMLVTGAIDLAVNPGFRTELRASLRIPEGDAPLGERLLREHRRQPRR
jgi:putative membrane protein